MIIVAILLTILSVFVWIDLRTGGWVKKAKDPISMILLLGAEIMLGVLLPIFSLVLFVCGFIYR